MEIREIVVLLEARIEALVPELLPMGSRRGAEWVEANLAAGGLGSSLSVRMTGDKVGVWKHFAAGAAASGDLLDLIAYLRFGGNKSNALRWARRWLGLDRMDPGELEQTRRRAATQAAAAAEANARKREKRRRHAAAIWLSGTPRLAGTPAEAYLLARGIDLRALGRQPGVLRYHPSLYASEDEARHPALLAVVHGADNKICAVHRTYLAVQSDGSVTKAALEDPKMTLGSYGGGAIRLWRGERIDAETGEVRPGLPLGRAPAGSSVVVSEGIENALTCVCARPALRVLAAITVGNMGGLWLPDAIAEVVLLADNDPEILEKTGRPHPAVGAFDDAVQAHMAAGRRVRIARAPAGFKDINDLATSKGVK